MKFLVQVAAAVATLLPVHVISAVVTSSDAHHPHHHHHPHGGQVRGSASTHSVPKVADAHLAVLPDHSSTIAPTDPVHLEIQKEVASMEEKISELHDVRDAMEFAGKLADMEVELSKTGEAAVGVMLMDRISKVRANLCVEHHLMSSEIKDCKTFMQRACHSNDPALQVPAAKCHQFFLHSKTRVHEEAGPAPSPFAAPAAAPAGSPGGAEVDERGLTAAQKAEALRIWTQGGKLEGALPEQGFSGEMVNHDFMHSMTEDWNKEFGPAADHKSFIEVCADHPNNEWCRLHGYYKEDTPKPTEWYDEFGVLRGHAQSTGLCLVGLVIFVAVASM